MSEASTSVDLLILCTVSASCAVIGHWRIRSYFKASSTSALAGAALFEYIVWLQIGYLYPFTVIAIPMLASFAFSLLITGTIALLVGIPFRAKRFKATT